MSSSSLPLDTINSCCFSAFISATCFLASMPRNPAWINVAAFSTSGSSMLISISTVLSFVQEAIMSSSMPFVTDNSFCFSTFISAACFPAWRTVAAFSTSGSFISMSWILLSSFMSEMSGIVFVLISLSVPLVTDGSFCFSAIISATCFLASIPRNPAWSNVAAFSTSGSSMSISISLSWSLDPESLCDFIWIDSLSLPFETMNSFCFSAFISATCFLASMPLYPAWSTVAAFSTSGSSISILIIPSCSFSPSILNIVSLMSSSALI